MTTTQYNNRPPKPNNYLVLSILATIFCCLPFGIVGIINAAKVDNAYYSGNYEYASYLSHKASKWTWIAIIASVVMWIAYIGFFMILALVQEL